MNYSILIQQAAMKWATAGRIMCKVRPKLNYQWKYENRWQQILIDSLWKQLAKRRLSLRLSWMSYIPQVRFILFWSLIFVAWCSSWPFSSHGCPSSSNMTVPFLFCFSTKTIILATNFNTFHKSLRYSQHIIAFYSFKNRHIYDQTVNIIASWCNRE